MSNTHFIAAACLAKEIKATTPSSVQKNSRGLHFARHFGFTGPAAYLDQELLAANGYTLDTYVQELLEWHDTFDEDGV